MPRPAQLVKPPLAAFEFINRALHGTWIPGGKKSILFVEYDQSKFVDNDRVHAKDHFQYAWKVKSEFMAPLAAMTNATFERLVGGFDYEIQGVKIRTKDDLEYVSTIEIPDENEETFTLTASDVSPEQMQAFRLYHAKPGINVKWHDVVDLYNESEPDQQEAIHQFFNHFMNRSLEDLVRISAPEPLPANLFLPLDTRSVDGKPCTYNEFTNSFTDDQQMILNFRVVGFRGESRNDINYVIASSMSLEEAVAIAIRYTQNITEKDTLQQITVHHGGAEIAKAYIVSARPIPPGSFDRSLPARLRWNLPARLRWNFDNSVKSGISPERFTQAIIAAEDAMGVKWRKGIMLEDALGL